MARPCWIAISDFLLVISIRGAERMLVIRSAQMKAFEDAAQLRFENEMVAHSKKFSPRLCEVLGDEQLRVAVRGAMGRAAVYGFTYRGPIRLFIEMMFLRGTAFDTDPQYHVVGRILRGPGDQMVRAQQIHEEWLEYLEQVSGPGAAHVHGALKDISVFVQQPISYSAENLTAEMLRDMTRLFPQKVAYVGEEALTALIQEGREAARQHGFASPRAAALVVTLMFAFGHGCTDDPLYPWIARTLADEKILDSNARAARLERKAITWLEHVVARNERRATT